MKLSKIQLRLTLSYLFTTFMVIFIMVALTIGGYFIYLKTDLAARWAGDKASLAAQDFQDQMQSSHLDTKEASDYLTVNYGDVNYSVGDTSVLFTTGETALILDVNGMVIASSDEKTYPVNVSAMDGSVDGVSVQPILQKQQMITYHNLGKYHAGQAPILNKNNKLIGWFFYKAEADDVNSMVKSVAGTLAIPALVTILLAALASGVTGLFFASSFTKQIRAIQYASRDFASGHFERRIPVKGNDEFAELSAQFNRMADQLQTQMRDLRDLADKNVLLAEEARQFAGLEERNRLARELHDAVKQQLFGLNLLLGSIQSTSRSDTEAAIGRLDQAVTQVQNIQNELDHIIKALLPASLLDRGLVSALETLTTQWSSQTNISVNFRAPQARDLPLQIEQGMYRVAQEALQNIGKHAHAEKVDVILEYREANVILTISDDGVGFDVQNPVRNDALGLASMRQRAKELNGEIKIDSRPGKWTTITLTVPVKVGL